MSASDDRVNHNALTAERITVRPGRLCLDTRIADGVPTHTTPALAEAALALDPTLAHHSCINSKGPTFGAVIAHTPLPHLLEHLIIAQEAALADNQHATFVGTTTRTGTQTARVEISFTDDLIAIQAAKEALEVINRLLLS